MDRTRALFGAALIGALALAMFAEPARAQKPRASEEKRLLADKDKLSGAETATFTSLREGRVDIRPENKPLLEKAARWHVYRLTYTEIQEGSTKGGPSIYRIVQDCLRQIPDLSRVDARESARGERQRLFVQEFGKALVATCEDVLRTREPIARINAARILARLGESGVEEFADPLAKVVEDKDQIDAVKLYALRGLKELFGSVEKFKDPAREARAAQAVIAFIERPMTAEAPSAEEVNAFHYVRREAVAALAKCRSPAIEVNKKIACQPALVLLRVVSRDGFKDRPILSERLEAAVGIGTMETKRSEKFYNPDYAAQHVGYFLVDFVNKYHADRQKQQPIPDEPWKIDAARLRQSLLTMQNENRKNKYVIELTSKAENVLQLVERSQPVPILPTGKWLEANPPPSKSLFKNDDKAVVKLPTPTEA